MRNSREEGKARDIHYYIITCSILLVHVAVVATVSKIVAVIFFIYFLIVCVYLYIYV